jgi:cytochrome b6-f complex iron-sulfur subunit
MERRDFLKTCAIACGAGAALSLALTGCDSVYYAKASVGHHRMIVQLTEFIDEKGIARPFVVVRHDTLDTPICIYKIGEEYFALDMKCTHSGCEVRPNKISVVCPCHGSEFSNKGKVLNPPAERDLKTYKNHIEGEYLIVQV